MPRQSGVVVVLLACLALVGCLPSDRINSSCRFTDGAPVMPDEGARRAHLVQDVRVARELGVRFADSSAGRWPSPAWARARNQCTERSLAEVVRRHQVSDAELTTLALAREPLVDLFAVMLPAALLFVVMSRVAVARILREYDAAERGVGIGVLAAVMPVAAGVGLSLTQAWGVTLEQFRLRSNHISYRAAELPAARHAWLLWMVAMLLFAATAVREVRLPRRMVRGAGRRTG